VRGQPLQAALLLLITRTLREILDIVKDIDADIEDVNQTMTDISTSLDALLAEVTTEIDQATAALQTRVDELTGENVALSEENAALVEQLQSSITALTDAKDKIDAKTEELRANNPSGNEDPHPDQTLPGDLPK
jgi:chromosome segregation ATPase